MDAFLLPILITIFLLGNSAMTTPSDPKTVFAPPLPVVGMYLIIVGFIMLCTCVCVGFYCARNKGEEEDPKPEKKKKSSVLGSLVIFLKSDEAFEGFLLWKKIMDVVRDILIIIGIFIYACEQLG